MSKIEKVHNQISIHGQKLAELIQDDGTFICKLEEPMKYQTVVSLNMFIIRDFSRGFNTSYISKGEIKDANYIRTGEYLGSIEDLKKLDPGTINDYAHFVNIMEISKTAFISTAYSQFKTGKILFKSYIFPVQFIGEIYKLIGFQEHVTNADDNTIYVDKKISKKSFVKTVINVCLSDETNSSALSKVLGIINVDKDGNGVYQKNFEQYEQSARVLNIPGVSVGQIRLCLIDGNTGNRITKKDVVGSDCSISMIMQVRNVY